MSRHQGPPPPGRILWVDTGRGLAIVLVALFHSTNWLSGAGLPEHGWTTANEVVATLRMPLFFTLSGLFAAKWLHASWGQLVRSKIVLFAWMFVLWGAIGTAAQLLGLAARGDAVNPLGSLRDYLLSPLQPRLELWFIWALGLFFIIAKLTRRVPPPVLLAAAAVVSAAALTDWEALTGDGGWAAVNVGWAGMAKYFVFFLSGLLFRRRLVAAVDAVTPLRGAVVLVGWLGLSLVSVLGGARAIPGVALLTALAGVAAGLVIARALSGVRLLPFLGARTLPIYVTHTPLIIVFVAALTPVLAVGPRPVLAMLLPPVLAAVAITIGVVLDTAVRNTRLRVLFEPPRRRTPGGTVSDPVRVLQSFPEPRATTNPYIVMLRDALDRTEGVSVRTFTWRRALFGRYDVFHVHWPEILPRGTSPLKTLLRHVTTAALVARWRLTGTPVVRTQHNIASHEGSTGATRRLLDAIDTATRLTIDLNGRTPALGDRPQRTILHGHYRDWYRASPHPRAVPGRLGCIGMIRPYKGIDTLVAAVVDAAEPSISLVVAGKPLNETVMAGLRRAAGDDPRVLLSPGFLSDDEFAARIGESELIVLPYPAMLNSGGALAALSLDRPVLVPDNPVTRALAEEVGRDWVSLFRGPLTAAAVTTALAQVRRTHGGRPSLDAREWGRAGQEHREAYREALRLRGDSSHRSGRRARSRRSAATAPPAVPSGGSAHDTAR